MKKTIVASAVFAAAVFGAGYTIGQVGGVTGISAASPSATPTTLQTAPNNQQPDHSANSGAQQDAPHADGTVTAINGDTLTISAGTDPSGTTEYTGVTTVVLTSTTQYEADHDSTAAAGKSSIKVGSYIIVDGTLSTDGKTITATRVGTHAGGPVPGR